jgi:Plant transposon protein
VDCASHDSVLWFDFTRLVDGRYPLLPMELDEYSLSGSDGDPEEFLADDDDEVALLLMGSLNEIIFLGDDAEKRSRGGSIPGRGANAPRDFDAALDRLKRNYIGLNGAQPLHNDKLFARRYGVPRAVFDMIFSALVARPELKQRTDALGKKGIHGLQRITGAMRILRYGTDCDAVDEIVSVSESVLSATLKHFCAAIIDEFGDEYLREPTENDMKRILVINEPRGFPGCLGSLDCQHWEWKNCPVAWAGQFKGKEKKPIVAMEAIADGELWIWHLSVGHPGSMNDLNIMNVSRTIQRLLSGQFPPRIRYMINGTERNLQYWLADGIYPNWAIFVETAKGSTERKMKFFSSKQEAVRKDVERAFGVLVSRWHILHTPCRMWDKEEAMNVLRACIILHNLCVEWRRDSYNVPLYGRALAEDVRSGLQFGPQRDFEFIWESSDAINNSGVPLGAWAAMAATRREQSIDEVEHFLLRGDLIEHLWVRRVVQGQDERAE